MAKTMRNVCVARLKNDVQAARVEAKTGTPKGVLVADAEWGNGDVVSVSFIGGTKTLHDKVEAIAKTWMEHANLTFVFRRDTNKTLVRIAFDVNDGHWSYVGKAVIKSLSDDLGAPTMNLGIDEDSDAEDIRRVVLHEFGHTLGLAHEHQNPVANIKWNKRAVRDDLSGPPNNWDDETIDRNMFEAEPASKFTPSDKTSIMMYSFPPEWTLDGFSAPWNTELSAVDKTFIADIYPKV